MAVKMTSVWIAYICVNFIAFCTSDSVPVLSWSNIEMNEVPSVPAGHSLSQNDFGSVLKTLGEQSKQNILVFLQNKLSLDDITHHANVYSGESQGEAYHNLKNLMQTHSSTHLPRVADPSDAIDEWKKNFEGKVHDLFSPFRVRDLPLNSDASNMVVVHLPDKASHSEETDSLRNIDSVIGSVSSEVEGLGKPYTALYTASAPSKVKVEPLYFGRHLLAETTTAEPAASKPHIYKVDSCILFYAETIVFEIKTTGKTNSTKWTIPPTTNTEGSSCGGSNPTLVLKFDAVGSLTALDMSIEFGNTTTGYWLLKNWNVTYKSNAGNGDNVRLVLADSTTPYQFSYHCTSGLYDEQNNSTSSGKVVPKGSVYAKNLQFQAFDISTGVFGYPNDCVGFFTIPIWSGIITTLLLISILAFGIMMLANINTMDRFDDPKGKTISVNVNE